MALSMRTNTCLRATQQRAAVARSIPSVVPRRVAIAQPRLVARAEADGAAETERIMKDLQAKWDALDNKPQVFLYGAGAVFALWLTGTVIGAINHVPLLPKLLELVGLGYSAWFTYRYLLFKASREELIKDVEELKGKITGN
uniref:Cyanobacterial aminoacyl-tRNA synthetase CAAD domain-containing protein n=1 Tax=Chlamydomonas leiostraca TaxID=1034604 RepID=A0A7S0R9T7_9CHLO